MTGHVLPRAERSAPWRDGPVAAELARRVAGSSPGELVIQGSELIGRVYVVPGALGWAHCGGQRGYLADRLIAELDVDRATLGSFLAGARRAKLHLGDFLTEQGLVDESVVRRVLLRHISRQLRFIDAGASGARMLFSPSTREFRSRFRFTLEEVARAVDSCESVPPPRSERGGGANSVRTPRNSIADCLGRLLSLPGATLAGLGDENVCHLLRADGITSGKHPICDIHADFLSEQREILGALGLAARREDIVVTLEDHVYVVRPVGAYSGAFLCIALNRAAANLVLVRRELAHVAESLALALPSSSPT